MILRRCLLATATLLFAVPAAFAQQAGAVPPETTAVAKDNIAGPYVPTPWVIVDEMLKLADIRADDVVYDLGSGDGRLVITASKRFGSRGVGVELQPELVELARNGARQDGVEGKVKFLQGDLFETGLGEASVVTLYLLPRFVTRLIPKLRAELKPGSRIVSHDYPLSPWPPDKTLTFDVEEKEVISGSMRTTLFYYVVPAQIGGAWELSLPKAFAAAALALEIRQEPDHLSGTANDGRAVLDLRDPSVRAERIRFGLFHGGKLMTLAGRVAGDTMYGEVVSAGQRESWSARRVPVKSPAPRP